MADIANVQLGPCDITYKGIAIGHTLGGVEVSYEPEYTDIAVDAYGSTPVNKILKGEKLTAKFKLAEFTMANLRNAIPQGEFAGAANARVTIGHKQGQSALADSGQLVIHPQDQGTRRHDVVFHKAIVADTVVIPHNSDEVKAIEVTMQALLDETKSDGNYLGLFGDSTA